MALIRVMPKKSGFQNWLDQNPKIVDLMRDPFGYKGEPVSVYEVIEGIDETRAIAAHYLTYNRSPFELVWALRVYHPDCDNSGITVRESQGNTGITEIDAKHRDLIGNEDQFKALIQRVLEAIRRGEDRIRLVGRSQIKHHVQTFVHLSSGGANERALERCRKLLVCISEQGAS